MKAKAREKRTDKKTEGYVIHYSNLSRIIKRLGSKNIKKIEQLFTKKLIQEKIINGKILYSDTTSLEKNITYPTEVGLLKRVIEHAEQVVQGVLRKKDMVKSEVIKKANQIARVYYSAKRRTKKLLNSMTKQLLEIAEKIMGKAAIIIKKTGKVTDIFIEAVYEKVKTTGKKIIKQISDKMEGKEVTDKIVSYYEPHVRALPKGKVNKPCEFGTKLRIDMTGNKYITNYQLYQGNPADVTMLEKAIENHSKIFPTTFKAAGMDRGYYDEEKIQQLENAYEISLAIPHKKRTTLFKTTIGAQRMLSTDQPLSKRKQKIFDKRSRI